MYLILSVGLSRLAKLADSHAAVRKLGVDLERPPIAVITFRRVLTREFLPGFNAEAVAHTRNSWANSAQLD